MDEVDSENMLSLNAACRALQEGKRTLLLSTLGSDGIPEISYAPYVRDNEGRFYIFISELAAHTKNLVRQPNASVMFIANEESSQNLFARERLIFKCTTTEVALDSSDYLPMLDKLEASFGNIVGMLRGLSDFHLFCLQPFEGQYVVGFGKAYSVKPDTGELEHISEARLKRQRTD